MTDLRLWFAGRSSRERWLILVMLALAAVTLAWGGIVRPLGDALASEQERARDAETRLATTQAAVDELRQARARHVVPITGALADAVRTEAAAAGFELAGLDVQGPDRVHVTLKSARAGALMAWLARMERLGILVDNARLTDNGDRTVGVDLTLRERGR